MIWLWQHGPDTVKDTKKKENQHGWPHIPTRPFLTCIQQKGTCSKINYTHTPSQWRGLPNNKDYKIKKSACQWGKSGGKILLAGKND